MESRWHATTDSDVQLELHASRTAWNDILKHLERQKNEQEAIDKKNAHINNMKTTASEMTKDWTNCKYNRSVGLYEQKLKAKKLDDEEKIKQMEQRAIEKQEEQRKYIEARRKSLYMKTSYPRQLNTALFYVENQYENDKQLELRKTVKQHEREVEAIYAEKVKEGVIAEAIEKEEYLIKQKQIKEETGKQLLAEISRKSELQRQEKESKIKEEAEEIKKTYEEMEILENNIKEQFLEAKQRIKNSIKESFAIKKAAQELAVKEDKEQDEIIAIIQEAKHKMECTRLKKLKEAQAERDKGTEQSIKQREEEERQRQALEDQLIKKAYEDREKQDQDVLQAKRERAEQMKQDRIDDRRNYCERKEAFRKKQEQVRLWECVNRFKTNNVIEEYNDNCEKERWAKILNYRAELQAQTAEKVDIQEKERQAEVARKELLDKGFLDDDKQFFEYAKEVRDLAESRGRITYPIDKVIRNYKKNVGIIPPSQYTQRVCQNVSTNSLQKTKKK